MKKGHGKTEEAGFSGRRQIMALKIMAALSGVDEELLQRSEEADAGKVSCFPDLPEDRAGQKKRRNLWKDSGSWAAVFCLALVGVLGWGGYQLTRQGAGDAGSTGNGAANTEAIEIRSEENGMAEGGQAEDRVPVQEEAGDAGDMDAAEEAEKEDFRSESQKSGQGDAGGAMSGGGEGAQDTEGGAVSPDKEQNSQEKAAGEEVNTETDSCPRANQVKYTEEEARNQEILGLYLPGDIPRGYVFDSAWCDPDSGDANLTVVWTRGMDSILWSIRVTEDVPETVDMDRPETYDLGLYKIPYGESVPARYRESVDNPVFSAEDFGMEAVAGRMVVYEDSGDTDTPRGKFAVLYPENVVVSFNGRGTPEEIWGMFSSMKAGE